MNYALTIGIVLAEFLAVGVVVFFVMRRRCRVKAAATATAEATQPAAPKHGLRDFLESELARMRQVVDILSDDLSSEERQALGKRIAMLEAEYAMCSELEGDDSLDSYQQVVVRHYRADEQTSPEFNKLQAALAGYQQKVENLERFRELFFKSQDKLSESFGIIQDLQEKIASGGGSDEETAGLVARLEAEKRKLQSELDIADHEFEAIMGNLSDTPAANERQPDMPDLAELEETVENLRGIEEENQFLQEQIQFLLKQELERGHQFEADIEALKQQLEQKDASHSELEQKYLEMEGRYLQLVNV